MVKIANTFKLGNDGKGTGFINITPPGAFSYAGQPIMKILCIIKLRIDNPFAR